MATHACQRQLHRDSSMLAAVARGRLRASHLRGCGIASLRRVSCARPQAQGHGARPQTFWKHQQRRTWVLSRISTSPSDLTATSSDGFDLQSMQDDDEDFLEETSEAATPPTAAAEDDGASAEWSSLSIPKLKTELKESGLKLCKCNKHLQCSFLFFSGSCS